MFKIYGEIYTIDIQPTKIDITSDIPSLKEVHIIANPGEDFSIFDLGPAIVEDITMLAENIKVGEFYYPQGCLRIKQKAGKWVEVTIRAPRQRPTDPIDSGPQIHFIRDYVMKYE